jgi:hypothetical protein
MIRSELIKQATVIVNRDGSTVAVSPLFDPGLVDYYCFQGSNVEISQRL